MTNCFCSRNSYSVWFSPVPPDLKYFWRRISCMFEYFGVFMDSGTLDLTCHVSWVRNGSCSCLQGSIKMSSSKVEIMSCAARRVLPPSDNIKSTYQLFVSAGITLQVMQQDLDRSGFPSYCKGRWSSHLHRMLVAVAVTLQERHLLYTGISAGTSLGRRALREFLQWYPYGRDHVRWHVSGASKSACTDAGRAGWP